MKYEKFDFLFFFFWNLGIILGAWSVYNATHPSRQNNVANLAVNIRKDSFDFYYLYLCPL